MNYPNKINNNIKNNYINYKNRGMNLEEDINITNKYYIDNKKAYIYKKPTPIKVVNVEFNKNSKKIKEAFFLEPSTTDYNGCYKGLYIDFEAKETNNTSSFPLNNIHKHQIEHIRNIYKENGIVFLIIRFNKLDKTYLLLGKDFINFIDKEKRKSIPIKYIEDNGYIIEFDYNKRCDYLKIIDNIYGGVLNGK